MKVLSTALSWFLAIGLWWTALADRPNVIVIFTDDQGWPDLGCQGQLRDLKTPHLDRFAKEGVQFTDGYVTAPQCCPSRSGLLTGRYQQRYGPDVQSAAAVTFVERHKDEPYQPGTK